MTEHRERVATPTLINKDTDLVAKLREAADAAHRWFIDDQEPCFDCALPAYLNEAANRLAALTPPTLGGWREAELEPKALEAALEAHLDGVGCTPWKHEAWDRKNANGEPRRVAIKASVERAITAYLAALPAPPGAPEPAGEPAEGDCMADRHRDLGRLMQACGVHNDGLSSPAQLFERCLSAIPASLGAADPAGEAGSWRYSINHGPEGETDYAMVYDESGQLVGNFRMHHAYRIVNTLSAPSPPPVPDGVRRALERIANAPAWGAPDRWETTPAEVRQLALAALSLLSEEASR